ncbi:hypothetical protein ARMGADRAFT_1092920 [Armillaria gallica]|uniref:Uncharacterized protein n=1 Tax=Armillaria gallica TaxID=47427 RepID=A0A2H3CWG8_ARMGA|nr:hypothetical protein ARMGADRAFT_1092920 [Armillaria gallica]
MVGGWKKSIADARPTALQMPHDLDTSINVALDFPAKQRGMLTYATMMVFGGWDQCRRRAHEANTEEIRGILIPTFP